MQSSKVVICFEISISDSVLDRFRLRKVQINLLFRSACTIFAVA